MKRFTMTLSLLLCLGQLMAQTEGNSITTRPLTPAAKETGFRNALWYNSVNRAGLAFKPFHLSNELYLDYDWENGKFRPQTVGETLHTVSLKTSGAALVGKFMLMGNFSFINRFEKNACFNTLLYEVADDMPYFILDPNPSGWVKQEYDLGASLVSPVIADRIAFGLKLHYETKVGAKQKDPRSETYKYHVEVIPSLTVHLGKTHLLGFHGLFDNGFERGVPTLNNYMVEQKIAYNKGLGEGMIGKVGGNDGVKTIFYRSMRYGGGLQYGWGKEESFLLDLSYIGRSVDGFEQPTLPKRLGSTRSNDLQADLQVTFGKHKSNKFTLNALYSSTKGLEHVQKMNTESFNQHWEVISTNKMMLMNHLSARLTYDHLFGHDEARGWDWKTGGSLTFSNRDDCYQLPRSTFKAMYLLTEANGGRQFKFKTSTLLVALSLGYQATLDAGYFFGGKNRESMQVNYYMQENAYLSTDFLKTGGRVSWTCHRKKINWVIDLRADWAKPLTIQDNRLLCSASIGIIF